jgi:glycosyltransferase involved in cell wall biosynthesis
MGKGASVRKAFEIATSEYILIQDADLEYSPEEYDRLLKPLIDGYADAVFGSRFLTYETRRVGNFWHTMGNRFLTSISNALSNIYLTDMETCYKVIKLEFAQKLKIRESRFGIEPEITAKLAKLGARIYEVPISYHGRTYQEGKKITWKDGFSAIRCVLKYNLQRVS